MAKLTKNQLSLATKAYYGALPGTDPAGYHTSSIEKGLEAAAPFLQLPWDEPTDEEIAEIIRQHWHWNGRRKHISEVVRFIAGQFVDRRNAAFTPKPADPRREKIIAALRKREFPIDLENEVRMVDNIIDALDAVKL